MSAPQSSLNGPQLLAASCAGGMSRQFRVQVRDQPNLPQWSLVGSFRDRQVAETVAAGLSHAGRMVRVVACRSLPTAA